MSAFKKPGLALVGVLAMLLAGLFFATSSASAYPAGTAPVVSVSDTTPQPCETITVSGSHYQPGETITISLGGTTLGTVTADSSGSFSTSVKIPCDASGTDALTVTGSSSGDVASISLIIGGSGNSGGTNSGGLSSTGVAVVGVGALGLVLLVGGGLLLVAGKRRRLTV